MIEQRETETARAILRGTQEMQHLKKVFARTPGRPQTDAYHAD